MEAKAFHNELKGEKPNLNAISTENMNKFLYTLTKMNSTVNTLLIIDAVEKLNK